MKNYIGENSIKKILTLIKGEFTPLSRKINGKSLETDIELSASDVGALSDTTEIPSIEGLATEDYVNKAIAAGGGGGGVSGDALLKTGDTMEGVLKFTPDVHYGATLPEAGETGQIYFVEAEEAFLENKDGVVQTNNVNNKAITRAKLANDALYSPIGWNTEITAANIGQTMRINWNAATTFRLTQTNSSTIDAGAEIAFLRWGVADIDVLVVGSGGIRFALPGETGFKTNATLKIPETFGMIALKKIETSATNGDTWLVTGNVEVVS